MSICNVKNSLPQYISPGVSRIGERSFETPHEDDSVLITEFPLVKSSFAETGSDNVSEEFLTRHMSPSDMDSNKKENVSRKRKIQEVFNCKEISAKKMKKDESYTPLEKHHTLCIQSNPKAPYLDYFRKGIKKAEGRINYSTFSKFKIGDAIYFHNRRDGILCKIVFINPYKSFAEMLTTEGVLNMLPQLNNEKPSALFEKALSIYKKFPNADRAKELGVIAIGVEFIRDKIPNRKNQT